MSWRKTIDEVRALLDALENEAEENESDAYDQGYKNGYEQAQKDIE